MGIRPSSAADGLMRWRVAGGLFVGPRPPSMGSTTARVRAELPVAQPIVVVGDNSTEVLDTSGGARPSRAPRPSGRARPRRLPSRRRRARSPPAPRRPRLQLPPSRRRIVARPDQRPRLARAAGGLPARHERVGAGGGLDPVAAEPFRIEGDIVNSLYEAIDAQVGDDQLDAAQRQRLAWDLADIYAWQVDFTRDIHRRQVPRGVRPPDLRGRRGAVGAGARQRSHHVGQEPDGLPVRAAAPLHVLRRGRQVAPARFLRAPVQFRRISSSFARTRRHPVLGITRRHQGTDYAASPGTPVMAAGDGVVLRAGREGGYGNLIELRHRTASPRATVTCAGSPAGSGGVRVTQGQTIGYVGSTASSEPHPTTSSG